MNHKSSGGWKYCRLPEKGFYIGLGKYCTKTAYAGTGGSLATAVPISALATHVSKKLEGPLSNSMLLQPDCYWHWS